MCPELKLGFVYFLDVFGVLTGLPLLCFIQQTTAGKGKAISYDA